MVELILWILAIIPGLVYHIWRGKKLCPSCGSTDLVPMNSPVGKELQQRFGTSVTQVKAEAESEKSDLRNGYLALLVLAALFVLAFYVAGRH